MKVLAVALLGLGALAAGCACLAGTAPPARAGELIGRLAADDFDTRERAEKELEGLGAAVLPTLRQALAGEVELESRRRLERLVNRIEAVRWAGSGSAVRWRVEKICHLNPKMREEDLVRSVYLLAVGRAPREGESAIGVRRLEGSEGQSTEALELALSLVRGREFNEDLSAASGKLLAWQEHLHGRDGKAALALLPGSDALRREINGKLEKGAAGLSNRHLSELLFLLTLSRLPKEAELKNLDAHYRTIKERPRAIEDVLWALMNSNEFLLTRRP